MWSTLAEKMGKKWGHMAASVHGYSDPIRPAYTGGVLHREGAVTFDQKLFSRGVLCCVLVSLSIYLSIYPQRVRPQPWVSQNDVS